MRSRVGSRMIDSHEIGSPVRRRARACPIRRKSDLMISIERNWLARKLNEFQTCQRG